MNEKKAIEHLAKTIMNLHVDLAKASIERDAWMLAARSLASKLAVFEPYSDEHAEVLVTDFFEDAKKSIAGAVSE